MHKIKPHHDFRSFEFIIADGILATAAAIPNIVKDAHAFLLALLLGFI